MWFIIGFILGIVITTIISWYLLGKIVLSLGVIRMTSFWKDLDKAFIELNAAINKEDPKFAKKLLDKIIKNKFKIKIN